MQIGMDEMRLIDGACICDVLVQAPPETIVAAFGQPVKLAENGRAVADQKLERDVVFYAAACPGLTWSVVEAVSDDPEPPDHIVTMLRQTRAVLTGNVLSLPFSYENGLGVAQRLSQTLAVPAIAVWGSDEWRGLGGGALFDASGSIVRACNVSRPETIDVLLAERERLQSEDYDPDEEDDEPLEDDDIVVVFEPGNGLRVSPGEIIPFLDGWFKELNAAQPKCPPSLWGFWEDYAEVWGALKP